MEYLYVCYLCEAGLNNIFISLLFASNGSEAAVRHVYIPFIFLIQVWHESEEYLYGSEVVLQNIYMSFIFLIGVWGGSEEYLYLCYFPQMGLRRLWRLFSSLLFTLYRSEAGLRNIYITFIHLKSVWDMSQEYLYPLYSPQMCPTRVWVIFISLLLTSYGPEARLTNICVHFVIIWPLNRSNRQLSSALLHTHRQTSKFLIPASDLFEGNIRDTIIPHTCLKPVSIFLTLVSDLDEVNKRDINIPHTCLRPTWGKWNRYRYSSDLPQTRISPITEIYIFLTPASDSY